MQRREREAEEERDRQSGFIDFRGLVDEARAGRQATEGGVTARRPSEADADAHGRLDRVAKVPFGQVWDLVTQAILTLNPPADIVVVDEHRAAELPERWPTRGSERKRRRVEAEWNEAADGLAIPAWDTEASFSSGSGVADTYSRVEAPMHLGSNGVLYVGAGDQTPGGTHIGGSTYHTSDSVPRVWYEKWGAGRTIDNRREVATGFANLVVKHSLAIDL